MPPKTIRDEPYLYGKWLESRRGYSTATSRIYASYVRAAIRACGGNNPSADVLAKAFVVIQTKHPTTFATRKRAWEMFVVWNATERGVILAGVESETSEVEKAVTADLPDEVRDALRALRDSAISPRMIELLTWAHVSLVGLNRAEKVQVRHPSVQGEVWIVPAEHIRVLFSYAKPGGNLCNPLVPLCPGSGQPQPHRAIERAMNQYTEEQVRAMLEGTAPEVSAGPLPEEPKFDIEGYESYRMPTRKDLESVAPDGVGGIPGLE